MYSWKGGANVGCYALIVDSGSVVAIEAMPDTFEMLAENISWNQTPGVVRVQQGRASVWHS